MSTARSVPPGWANDLCKFSGFVGVSKRWVWGYLHKALARRPDTRNFLAWVFVPNSHRRMQAEEGYVYPSCSGSCPVTSRRPRRRKQTCSWALWSNERSRSSINGAKYLVLTNTQSILVNLQNSLHLPLHIWEEASLMVRPRQVRSRSPTGPSEKKPIYGSQLVGNVTWS